MIYIFITVVVLVISLIIYIEKQERLKRKELERKRLEAKQLRIKKEEELAEKLKNSEKGTHLYQKTGIPIHPFSPMTKIAWFKEFDDEIFSKTYKFISIKEYVFKVKEYMDELRSRVKRVLPRGAEASVPKNPRRGLELVYEWEE